MAELIITIDGPAGSGKSSTAKLLAARIGAAFLDTGAIYRTATLAAMQNRCDLGNIARLEEIIDSTDFKFEIKDGKMAAKINNSDVTEKIRDPQVTANVHFIASVQSLRSRLVKKQRAFAAEHEKIVAEGRDQGTVVFPDADFKFFLTADAGQRAKRRAKELTENGYKVDLNSLQEEIEKRDRQDSTRKVSPLTPAADAITVDTTSLTLQQVVDKILERIKKND
ncbi:MAG: (d)CMP kinase [Phycisphaerae bacterium]|jgi:cytidylate kinase